MKKNTWLLYLILVFNVPAKALSIEANCQDRWEIEQAIPDVLDFNYHERWVSYEEKFRLTVGKKTMIGLDVFFNKGKPTKKKIGIIKNYKGRYQGLCRAK